MNTKQGAEDEKMAAQYAVFQAQNKAFEHLADRFDKVCDESKAYNTDFGDGVCIAFAEACAYIRAILDGNWPHGKR